MGARKLHYKSLNTRYLKNYNFQYFGVRICNIYPSYSKCSSYWLWVRNIWYSHICSSFFEFFSKEVRRLVVLRIYVASAVFQPYRDLEAGDNQSMKIQVARPGKWTQSSCSASQELNHSATAAPTNSPLSRNTMCPPRRILQTWFYTITLY